jgi:hypothetical protein
MHGPRPSGTMAMEMVSYRVFDNHHETSVDESLTSLCGSGAQAFFENMPDCQTWSLQCDLVLDRAWITTCCAEEAVNNHFMSLVVIRLKVQYTQTVSHERVFSGRSVKLCTIPRFGHVPMHPHPLVLNQPPSVFIAYAEYGGGWCCWWQFILDTAKSQEVAINVQPLPVHALHIHMHPPLRCSSAVHPTHNQ